MSLLALTSLSPSPAAVERQRFCLESWHRAGLDVMSFNHISEAVGGYGVQVALVERTSLAQYGRHVIPLNEFLKLIDTIHEPALIINADNELRVTAAQIQHLTELSTTGVPMLTKIHHDADGGNACMEPAGFDAFLLSPRHCHLYAESFLSLGQPWWDYWVPWMVKQLGEPLYLPKKSVAFHLRHSSAWGQEPWNMGAVELGRLIGIDAGLDHAAHSQFSAMVFDAIQQHATRVEL